MNVPNILVHRAASFLLSAFFRRPAILPGNKPDAMLCPALCHRTYYLVVLFI